MLHSLVEPLKVYLGERDELLMVSGFTDDLPINEDNRKYDDNWDLSAQRALTVVRGLIEEGMPPTLVFAAAFGEYQPVAPNRGRRDPVEEPSRGNRAGAEGGSGKSDARRNER